MTLLACTTYTDYYNKAFQFDYFPHLRGRVLAHAGLCTIVCLCVGAPMSLLAARAHVMLNV